MIINHAKIIYRDGIRNGNVKAENGLITALSDIPFEEDDVLDLQDDYYLAPGFVDIHTHGGNACDFMDNEEEAFKKILAFQAKNGITSVVASTVTAPKESILETLSVARKVMKKRGEHAKLLGVHLEGPYLSYENRGAHAPQFLRIPKDDDYGYILENADIIRQVTISPELAGAAELTKALIARGIVVALGHDNAILPEILPVIEAGASHLTHIFCAMSAVVMKDNKRYVGLREYGLINDNMTAELIADNHHLTPELVQMIYRCKGHERTCLISDCLRAGGMPRDGRLYSLGKKGDEASQKFMVSDGVAVLSDGSRYAGSIQPISQMLRNIVFDADVPLQEAVQTVSYTPARAIHCEDKIGSIEIGKCADFCILDRDLNVVATVIDGKLLKGSRFDG